MASTIATSQLQLNIVDKGSVRVIAITALPAYTFAAAGAPDGRDLMTGSVNGAFPAIDGLTLTVGQTFAHAAGASASDNGKWILTNAGSAGTKWTAERTEDADSAVKLGAGISLRVSEGTTYGGSCWFAPVPAAFTFNTTAITFTRTDVNGIVLHSEVVAGQAIPQGSADTPLTAILSKAPIGGKLIALFDNTAIQIPGAGNVYTISGQTITWLTTSGVAPSMLAGDKLFAVYNATS